MNSQKSLKERREEATELVNQISIEISNAKKAISKSLDELNSAKK